MEIILVIFAALGLPLWIGFIFYIISLQRKKARQLETQALKSFVAKHQFKLSEDNQIYGSNDDYRVTIQVLSRNDSTSWLHLALVANSKERQSKSLRLQDIEKQIATLLSKRIPAIHGTSEIKLSLSERSVSYKCFEYVNHLELERLLRLYRPLTELLEAYLAVGESGSVAMPILEPIAQDETYVLHKLGSPLRNVATQLVMDIARQNRTQFNDPSFAYICPTCLLRFQIHRVKISSLNQIPYCGCRGCHQSQTFLHNKQVEAVLNAGMTDEWSENQRDIQVNWLARRSLFDFDAVQIIQATDEDVERFAVQVGNDTDAYRAERYGQMKCTVSSKVQLSENTLRILRKTFGEVVVGEKSAS